MTTFQQTIPSIVESILLEASNSQNAWVLLLCCVFELHSQFMSTIPYLHRFLRVFLIPQLWFHLIIDVSIRVSAYVQEESNFQFELNKYVSKLGCIDAQLAEECVVQLQNVNRRTYVHCTA